MKVAFITRSSLFSSTGGDTIQVMNTARYLEESGVTVDIKLTNERINYKEYDLLHFFNLIRPADILPHVRKSAQPFVVTPLLINYSEFDKQYRKGISGKVFSFFCADQIEYLKTIARWTRRQEYVRSFAFLVKGQRQSVKDILRKAAMVLPNSQMEYEYLSNCYGIKKPYVNIPNGIEPKLFTPFLIEKEPKMVLCVARIEGLKNQINLIRALNNTEYQLYIIGKATINQKHYYEECQKIAAKNIHFIKHLSQEELLPFYRKAKVHVLPSWFETCGLSSLEAAAMHCAIVITRKGYASEYFQNNAFYCDPSSPESIKEAVDKASASGTLDKKFQQKIRSEFTWQNAALKTYEAYKKILLS